MLFPSRVPLNRIPRIAFIFTLFVLAFGGIKPRVDAQSFTSASDYIAGLSPNSVAVGDFNGDGNPDLVVGDQKDSSNKISVLLGTANGIFGNANSYTVGTTPASVAVGDFNKDGKLDLVAANRNSNSISVLLGNGDGTFQSAMNYATGTAPTSVVVGDFNNDGKLDLAVSGGGVAVLLGNGDGSFQTVVSYAVGTGYRSIIVGDFNLDGKQDLAAATGNGVSVLLGVGDGTFQSPFNYGSGSSVAITSGDFNADGKLDLAIVDNLHSSMGILLGNGNGTFQQMTSSLLKNAPTDVKAADFDGDGNLDLVITGIFLHDNVNVLLGRGDGTFKSNTGYVDSVGGTSVAVGDFNHDGRSDIAATVNGKVSALLNTTAVQAGYFGAPNNNAVGTHPASITAGDFNRDGKVDLATANYYSANISVLIGNGNGTFLGAVNYATGVSNPSFIVAADLNSDGKLDLAIGKSFNNISVLLGNGDGTFKPAVLYPVNGSRAIAVADFNGDGKLDLVAANTGQAPFTEENIGGNTISISLNNGDGTFQNPVYYNVGKVPNAIAVGDFNRDGKADVAVTNGNSSSVSVLLGNGNGTVQPASSYSVGASPSSIITADFNHDGKPDLAVASSYSNNNGLGILFGNGDGTFRDGVSYPLHARTSSIILGDFNLDGEPDLALADTSGDSVSVLIGDGNSGFRSPVNYVFAPGTDPQALTLGDFNKDGKPDIATANFNNSVSIILNTPDAQPSTGGTISGQKFQDTNANGVKDSGEPGLQGWTIFIDYNFNGILDTGEPSVLTDANGNYSFTNLNNGTAYRIREVQQAGWVHTTADPADIAIANSNVSGIDFGNRPRLIPVSKSLVATEGAPLSGTIASFNYYSPSGVTNNFTATINWGDGTVSSSASITDKGFGNFDINGAHTYAEEGSYSITIVVKDATNFASTIVSTATIADAPLTASGDAFSAVQGVPVTNILVAHFTDAAPGSHFNDFSAVIDWGDGTSSQGSIALGNQPPEYGVYGTHTYARTGSFAVVTTIKDKGGKDKGGSTATTNTIVNVTYAITGRIILPANDPVRILSPLTVNLSGSQSATTTTDANGYYSFAVNGGGNYTVKPSDTSYYTFTAQSVSNLSGNQTINFTPTLRTYSISGQLKTKDKAAIGGATVKLTGYSTATTTTDAGGNYSFTVTAGGFYTVTPGNVPENIYTQYFYAPAYQGAFANGNQTFNFTATTVTYSTLLFSNGPFKVNEGAGSISISVKRSGDASGTAIVDYTTVDVTANQKKDYTTSSGTLVFAPGETIKTFTVLVIDNAYVDGERRVDIILSNPIGVNLDVPSTVLFIEDNDTTAPTINPIDETRFFVRQQYLDFLNREPDPGGFDYWSSLIAGCPSGDAQCFNSKRVSVSAAFFIEQEFQDTGSFVYRFYKASYGQLPTYAQFIADRSHVVGGSNLEASKQAFADNWVQRPQFLAKYPATLVPGDFLDQLIATVRTATTNKVDLLVNRATYLNTLQQSGRGSVLRQIVGDASFKAAEYNNAFVLMQYFGYLRRDPDDAGYKFWLDVLNNRVANNYRGMVCAFITSAEYQDRFSSVRTRNDSVCGSIGP